METMKRILLLFDDQKELEFIKENLLESGFQVFVSKNLQEALIDVKKALPHLIVINSLDSEKDINEFNNQLKAEKLEDVSVLSLLELEDYLKISRKENFFFVKPVRPKLLLSIIRNVMNYEELNWLPKTSTFY